MTGTSKEYAIALFELAQKSGQTEEVLRGLELVRDVFDTTPDLFAFLRSPGIAKSVRIETLRSAFNGSVPEYVLSFLCLLCEHRNSETLYECIENYSTLYNEDRRLRRAVIVSAVELTDEEKDALCVKLEKRFSCKLKMEYRLDPSLLGGVIVETEDAVLDGSLRTRLRTMKEVIDT